jgi:hypothetical protein
LSGFMDEVRISEVARLFGAPPSGPVWGSYNRSLTVDHGDELQLLIQSGGTLADLESGLTEVANAAGDAVVLSLSAAPAGLELSEELPGVWRLHGSVADGIYSFGIVATAGAFSVEQSIRLSVYTSLRAWAESLGLTGDSLLPSADDDGDLITLLEEYAYNLDPTVNEWEPLIPGMGTAGLPVIRLVGDGDNKRLQSEFVRRRSDPNLNYVVEYGSDLSETLPDGFSAAIRQEFVTEVDENFERVIIDDFATVETHDRRFGRVRVTYQTIE